MNGSFVLGFDHDGPDVFERTVEWIEAEPPRVRDVPHPHALPGHAAVPPDGGRGPPPAPGLGPLRHRPRRLPPAAHDARGARRRLRVVLRAPLLARVDLAAAARGLARRARRTSRCPTSTSARTASGTVSSATTSRTPSGRHSSSGRAAGTSRSGAAWRNGQRPRRYAQPPHPAVSRQESPDDEDSQSRNHSQNPPGSKSQSVQIRAKLVTPASLQLLPPTNRQACTDPRMSPRVATLENAATDSRGIGSAAASGSEYRLQAVFSCGASPA